MDFGISFSFDLYMLFWNSISFSFYSIGLFSFLFYFIWYSFFGYFHELCQFSSKWNVRIYYIVRSFYCDLGNILTPYCGEATTKRRRLQPRCWCYSLRHKILISKAVLKENCSEIHAIVKNESGQSSLKGVLKPSSPLHLLWAESYESAHLKLFIRLLAFKNNTLKLFMRERSHNNTAQRCVLQFPFRWIYYYGSNKSTGKETGKTHLCALYNLWFQYYT